MCMCVSVICDFVCEGLNGYMCVGVSVNESVCVCV